MDIVAYGDLDLHYCFSPTASIDFLEYERFQMIETFTIY